MGREHKRSKSKSEKLIMTVLHKTEKGRKIENDEQAAVIEAVRKKIAYFKMTTRLDEAKQICHVTIIKEIYFKPLVAKSKCGKKDKIRKRKTMAGFAKDLFLRDKKLREYTDAYIKCFEEYYENPDFDIHELD